MPPDPVLADIPKALGTGAAPPVFVELAAVDAELLEVGWQATRPWLDSRFFEETAVLANAAVEEVAEECPPAEEHVRLGALGGADLPDADRMVEALVQATPRTLVVVRAWHRAITEPGAGADSRGGTKALVPGLCRFMCDPPRLPDDAPQRALAAAEALGVGAAAGELRNLTAWPRYLDALVGDVAATDLGAAVAVVTERADEAVAALAPPMPTLEGASGEGARVIAVWAEALPRLVTVAAFARLGLPQVARIPRVT